MNAENQPSNPDVESVFQSVENKKTEPRIVIQVGFDTDIGGDNNKTNQDRQTIIPLDDGYLIAMWDGHGTKSENAVEIADNLLHDLVRDQMDKLLKTPVQFLEDVFESMHSRIIEEFKNLKCGSTCSFILVLGKKMWIANVGDSTGILCAKHPIFKPSHLRLEKDVAIPEKESLVSSDEGVNPSTYLELTSEHSPEDPEEYKRMRNFKSCEHNPREAELMCVYDKQYEVKHCCPPVFNISEEDGEPSVRPDDGSFKYYYKNVRKEKATYVCHRNDGRTALASTRSLGDYGLNILGVSNKPIIKSMDLQVVFEDLKAKIDAAKVKVDEDEAKRLLDSTDTSSESGGGAIASESEPDPMSICVVLCTDGVWDNWIYEHVQRFVMDKSCLKAIENDKENGAKRVTKSFMLRNQTFARKNFGRSSDNATGIVMYLTLE
jgi:serine/threonine protein phosphatase PrpC